MGKRQREGEKKGKIEKENRGRRKGKRKMEEGKEEGNFYCTSTMY